MAFGKARRIFGKRR